MSKCIQEDKLRSFLDSELSAAESESTACHLALCAACASKLEFLRSEAADVDSFLGSLAPEQTLPTAAPALLPMAPQHRSARVSWTAALSLGALAVVIVAALLLLMRHSYPKAPDLGKQQPGQSAPSTLSANQPKRQKEAMLPEEAIHSQQAKRQRVSMRTPNHRPELRPFIPLDNDGPIEMGLIYRVKLPGSIFSSLDPAVLNSQISAEVIVDETGRARAIRFLQ